MKNSRKTCFDQGTTMVFYLAKTVFHKTIDNLQILNFEYT